MRKYSDKNVYEATLERLGFIFDEFDYTNEGRHPRLSEQTVLKFNKYPDDYSAKSFRYVPSYKRMCVCILKNDYYCKYMGFGLTKEAIEKKKSTLELYKNL